ncbi:Uncharacterised protein [Acinetobacter baumannii]|nr:Uncharacterised protein [Acinetobacter baumannii]
MPFGGDFRLRQVLQELGHALVGGGVFAVHHPQAGPADDGVLRRIFRVGVVRHHADAVVEFGVVLDVRQRTGRGGGDGAVAVIKLLGGFVFAAEIGEVALLVHRFEQRNMFDLQRLVELQLGAGAAKAVVFTGERHAVPGAEVLQLDPALPAAGVTALHAGFAQFGGIRRQFLPGFRRLVRVQAGLFEGVFVVVQHRRGAVERLRQQMAALVVGVIAGHRRHEHRLVEVDAGLFKHFIDRFDGFAGHHGGGAHLVNLQDRRRLAGAVSGDARRQALFVVAFINRHNLDVAVRLVEAIRQRVHFFTQFAFHRMPERDFCRRQRLCADRQGQCDAQRGFANSVGEHA